MKLVKCVVREEKVEETTEALKALELSGLTISRVSGRGQHEERTEFYLGIRYQVRVLPKVMIDVVAPDALVDDVVRVVTETARTGSVSAVGDKWIGSSGRATCSALGVDENVAGITAVVDSSLGWGGPSSFIPRRLVHVKPSGHEVAAL